LNALLGAGTMAAWHRHRGVLHLAILASAVLKALVEYRFGGALITQTQWPSVPGAHLAGLSAGLGGYLVWVLCPRCITSIRRQKPLTTNAAS
ncbi:MAG: hypothetical protein ACR2RL_15145, partial [Gammaproteobacteria bacterium]